MKNLESQTIEVEVRQAGDDDGRRDDPARGVEVHDRNAVCGRDIGNGDVAGTGDVWDLETIGGFDVAFAGVRDSINEVEGESKGGGTSRGQLG